MGGQWRRPVVTGAIALLTGAAGASGGGGSGGMTATLSPTSVFGGNTAPGSATTDSTTCTPADGTPAYTYLWTRLSGDSALAADSPTSATTTFTGYLEYDGHTLSATFACQVTDSLGNVVLSNIVSVSMTCIVITGYGEGGGFY